MDVREIRVDGTHESLIVSPIAVHKMKFSIKYFSSKCDQIRRKLRIWSHLLKKSLMQNLIFCAVGTPTTLPILISPSILDLEPDVPISLP